MSKTPKLTTAPHALKTAAIDPRLKNCLLGLASAATFGTSALAQDSQNNTTNTADNTEARDNAATEQPTTSSAAEWYAKAQAYESQAIIAYPKAFYDRLLWKKAVDSAYTAQKLEPSNQQYSKYLAKLYTQTGWWIKALESWEKSQDLNAKEKVQAAFVARKLAYSAWKRGDKTMARSFAQRGLAWQEDVKLRKLLNKIMQQ